MEGLKNIVNSLNKREIALVRLLYSHKSNAEESYRLKLFELIKKSKDLDDKKARDNIYKGKTLSAFSHLKKRLQNDILNIIQFQETTKKFRTRIATVSVEVKKMIVFSEILYKRGLTDEGDSIIYDGIKLADKYELPAEEYILTEMQRIRHGYTKGDKTINQFKKKIEKCVNEIKINADSIGIYYDLSVKNQFKSNQSVEELKNQELQIKNLHKNFISSKIAKNGFWYYSAEMYHHNRQNNFEKAVEYGLKLAELIKNNASIGSAVQIATVNKEISEIYIASSKYAVAIPHANESLTNLNPALNNYLLTLETLFYPHFYLGQYIEAEEVLKRAIAHPRFWTRKITFTRWNYFSACLEFARGNYKKCNELLRNDSKNLLADKGELQLGFRLLTIMLMVETGKEDLLEYELDSFRKSFVTIKNYKLDRIKLIQKILASLNREGWHFAKIQKKEADKFELLKTDAKCLWQPLGFELIQFEKWIEAAIKREESMI